MSYLQAVLTTWLLAFTLAVGSCQLAQAGVYIDAGLGVSLFQRTVEPGTWYQPPLPYQFDLVDPAWRIGAGYRFNERVSVQGYVSSLGTSRVSSKFVGDNEYDPHAQACFGPTCSNPHSLTAVDSVRVYELTASYHFRLWELEPFLRVGPALMTHRLTVNSVHNDGSLKVAHQHYGRIPTAVFGAGVCSSGQVQACLEATYYRGLGGMDCLTSCQWPIGKEVVVPMFSVRYFF